MHDYSRKRNRLEAVPPSPYTIDNTEDIYSTTLTPNQRCFVDPWDLENYDYVRKKVEYPLPQSIYDSASAFPSSSNHKISRTDHKLPLNSKYSSTTCELECCSPYGQGGGYNNIYSDVWNITKDFQLHENFLEDIYDYGALSSSSSYDENPSSIEENPEALRMIKSDYAIYPMPDPYAYSNPNTMDCYECTSVLYGYGFGVGGISSLYDSAERYSKSDTLYNKRSSLKSHSSVHQTQRFGLNSKGLLQIDYSCSWDDLDRAMGENYL